MYHVINTGLRTGNAVLLELRWVGEQDNTNTSVNVRRVDLRQKAACLPFPFPYTVSRWRCQARGSLDFRSAHVATPHTPHPRPGCAGQGTAGGKVAVVRTLLSYKDTLTNASPAVIGLSLPISRPLQSCSHPSVGYMMDWRSDEWVKPPQISNFT